MRMSYPMDISLNYLNQELVSDHYLLGLVQGQMILNAQQIVGPQFAVHSVSFVPELTPADNDQIPVPDLDSLMICPWDKTCAWVFADLYWNDRPYDVCPRLTLKKQIQKSAKSDLKFYVGIELYSDIKF